MEPGKSEGRMDYTLKAGLPSSEVVLKPLDVVFPEVGTALNFYKDQIFATDILYTMGNSGRDIDSVSR